MTDTLSLEDGVYDASPNFGGTVIMQEQLHTLMASAIPVAPPASWFAQPDVDRLTPLTISDTGRVFGHIASWNTSHIGMAGGVKPPKSKSDYAFFRTGVVKTDDDSFVDVGQITLAGGHASLNADARGAVAHYDDTNSAVMDVAAGEDRYGIWVAGALRPSISDDQIRAVRASSVSGDWRPINGSLELVAVCAVNCPGFPIPRARVASGATIALVAAGIDQIVEQTIRDRAGLDIESGIESGLALFRERIRNVEAVTASARRDLRERVHQSNPEPVTAASDLRSRVHSKEIAGLRSRAHPEPVTASAESPDIEALRSKVHPGVTAAAKTKTAPHFKTIKSGTKVTWHYRSGIGHGTVKGVHKMGTKPGNTMYTIEEHDHHEGEPPTRVHSGDALTIVSSAAMIASLRGQVHGDEAALASIREQVHGSDAGDFPDPR